MHTQSNKHFNISISENKQKKSRKCICVLGQLAAFIRHDSLSHHSDLADVLGSEKIICRDIEPVLQTLSTLLAIFSGCCMQPHNFLGQISFLGIFRRKLDLIGSPFVT